jgi:uncharacterized LabA/DUF88 family protein
MSTRSANVYIDGFNLYYGAVKGTPYKWLDIGALCRIMLPQHQIYRIRYFTALVDSHPSDPDQRMRQELFLRALRTIPNLTIHYGHFLTHVVSMPLAPPATGTARVIKTEEKGSDVNLAAHLLTDAFRNDCDVSVIVSNDSDLCEPLRIARYELGRTVGVLSPHKHHPSVVLRKTAHFFKQIRATTQAKCQFPAALTDEAGSFTKPARW